MRSSRTSASRFLWSTSLAGFALASTGFSCNGGGEECGSADAPATGLVASGTGVTMTYGNLKAGLNNDCPAADQPEGVVSMTIHLGSQIDGTGIFTLCVERPDQFNGARALGIDEQGNPVRVIDVTGTSNGCTLAFDDSVPPTGTATGSGVCSLGEDPAGFALELDGAVQLERDCAGTIDTVSVTLTGKVAIVPQ